MPDDVSLGTLPPATAGADCTDPRGDISDLASQVTGTLAEPSGIDLVSVTAEVSETDLTVTYTTAGPVTAVAKPEFLLSQGVSGQEPSFELRAKPTVPGGPWTLNLITWTKSGGGLVEAAPKPIATVVSVDGEVVTYTVALTDLPRIATLIWQFGTSAELPSGEFVLDDCNNMGDQPAPDATVAPGTTGPTTTIPTVELGASLTHRNGVTVTISEVQTPPAKVEPLAIPLDEGNKLGAVYVSACAGADPVTVRAASFGIQTDANEIRPYWEVPTPPVVPAFPVSRALEPGACINGWVPFQFPVADTIVETFYSPDSDGANYLIWKVPPPG